MSAEPVRPQTRDRLLDAFEELLVQAGPRAATLDAVASTAGVSKGGLLYHFASKDALIEGVLERLRNYSRADMERMRAAPEGAAAYYVRTSVAAQQDPLYRATIAALRLVTDADQRSVATLTQIAAEWLLALEQEVGDRTVARAVQLIGDGLWSNAAMGVVPDDLDEVLAILPRLRAPNG